MPNRTRVFAPASASNLGPGFDVLGLALPCPGDLVEAELREQPGVEIVEVTGDGGALSADPARNVVGIAAQRVLDDAGRERSTRPGLRLWLHKQMPLASGLGSSGASAVAGAVAANEALGRPLARAALIEAALDGERATSGSGHADNVAPSLLGGIVLIRRYEPLELRSLPVPEALRVVVVHPHCLVSTAEARALVASRRYVLADAVANLGNVAALVDALHTGDLELLGRCVDDRLVEPVRSVLIPGFQQVKASAIAHGALGCSISGSGPSMFAFTASDRAAAEVSAAMQEAFRRAADLPSDAYVGPVNVRGAGPVGDGGPASP